MLHVQEFIKAVEDQDPWFAPLVREQAAQHGWNYVTEDDDEDQFQPIVHLLQMNGSEFCSDSEELGAWGDYTLYREGEIYRLCQADTGGSYSLYFW